MTGKLRDDALAIWRASVDAVRSERLVRQFVQVRQGELQIGSDRWPLDHVGRIEVVGAGKAGAGMAAGLEQALGPQVLADKQVGGWINVPADCLRGLERIHLHAARPGGRNEPTAEGLRGAEAILRRVAALRPQDLCICLISGGGSALLPAPRAGIGLDDLLQVTRVLSAAGATIEQLNAVRKRLSRIHGGQLARACRAGQLVTLIISDVIGDPLDVIASGPTVVDVDERAAAQRAVEVLRQFHARGADCGAAVRQLLEADLQHPFPAAPLPRVINLVIGNNQTATQAAEAEAARRGYDAETAPAQPAEATAEQVGQGLAEMLIQAPRGGRAEHPWSVISGGEPVVQLVSPSQRGLGGRNQQLALAALCHLLEIQGTGDQLLAGQLILSGGTDGEDGPTDAAGALVDDDVVQQMRKRRLDPHDFLRRNDAYSFFAATGGLIRTGPTHTNVCDVRVALSR